MCAFGNTIDYKNAAPALTAGTAKTVAVAVTDQRPYVVAGSNTPQWVGMIRGGFGNPFGVHTASGDPFASDVAVAVAAGLKAQNVRAVVASSDADRTADRILRVTIREWKSDSMYNTSVLYDLGAEVTDASGKVLGRNDVKNYTVFNSFGSMLSTTLDKVVVQFKAAVADLLNAPDIQRALGS
ncbi:MAG: hypothetical protein HY985_18710 [Magnetospirillum sp.]|nr:hypothetical protein [Magnetospirillum sp.]